MPHAHEAGVPLNLPVGVTLNQLPERDCNLLDCYRIINPDEVARVVNNRSYTNDREVFKTHEFTLQSMTAKGAGGTGKTTMAITAAVGLVHKGKNVIIVNMDSQPSVEDRLLGKVVHKIYRGDWEAFWNLQGMQDSTIRTALETHTQEAKKYKLVPCMAVCIDIVRLASLNHNSVPPSNARLYVLRSDEEISEWEAYLSRAMAFAAVNMGDTYKSSFGAFYNLMQMYSYLVGASHVVVDLGPGNGVMNRNIITSSNGFFLVLNIDGKAHSTINSFRQKLGIVIWELQDGRQAQGTQAAMPPIRSMSAGSRYPVPRHLPKFMGLVFTRAGERGSVRPHNQFSALLKCYQAVSSLLDSATQLDMALGAGPAAAVAPAAGAGPAAAVAPGAGPAAAAAGDGMEDDDAAAAAGGGGGGPDVVVAPAAAAAGPAAAAAVANPADDIGPAAPDVYQAMVNGIRGTLNNAGNMFANIPTPVRGVVAIVRQFDTLQYMSERECVPVAYLQEHHFLTMPETAFDAMEAAMVANPNAPLPSEEQYLKKEPAQRRTDLSAKVTNIQKMISPLVQMIIDHATTQ